MWGLAQLVTVPGTIYGITGDMYKDRALTSRERRLIRALFPGGWENGAGGPDIQKFVEVLGPDNDLVKAVLGEALAAQDQMAHVTKTKKCKSCGKSLHHVKSYSGKYCKNCSPARNVVSFRESKNEEQSY